MFEYCTCAWCAGACEVLDEDSFRGYPCKLCKEDHPKLIEEEQDNE
jgi:hypothetical protein